MASTTYGLSPEIRKYLQDHSVNEHPAQVALRVATENVERSVMISSPEMGNFLQMMMGFVGARRCIEVGVYTGYSALSMALALPEDGILHAFDISEEWTSVGRPFWEQAGVQDKINLVLRPASESLQALIDAGEAGTFDFAFIDADKENYINYYERALKLVRAGGLVLIDNTLWSGAVADTADQEPDTRAIRALNEYIHARPACAYEPVADRRRVDAGFEGIGPSRQPSPTGFWWRQIPHPWI